MPSSNKKKSQKPRATGYRGEMLSQALPNPPQWSSTVAFQYVQRFVANSVGVSNRSITNLCLQDLKCVATAAAAASRIFGAVKLKSVEAWCANSSAGSANTIEIEMFTNNPYFGTNSKVYSDTAIGTSNVAHVKCRPPPGSFSADWLPNVVGTEYTVFDVTCPQGTIIDVTMVAHLIDEETAIAVTGAVAAATAGILYTRSLDNTNAAPKLTPVGDTTI
jgi:hypothetical protein